MMPFCSYLIQNLYIVPEISLVCWLLFVKTHCVLFAMHSGHIIGLRYNDDTNTIFVSSCMDAKGNHAYTTQIMVQTMYYPPAHTPQNSCKPYTILLMFHPYIQWNLSMECTKIKTAWSTVHRVKFDRNKCFSTILLL